MWANRRNLADCQNIDMPNPKMQQVILKHKKDNLCYYFCSFEDKHAFVMKKINDISNQFN